MAVLLLGGRVAKSLLRIFGWACVCVCKRGEKATISMATPPHPKEKVIFFSLPANALNAGLPENCQDGNTGGGGDGIQKNRFFSCAARPPPAQPPHGRRVTRSMGGKCAQREREACLFPTSTRSKVNCWVRKDKEFFSYQLADAFDFPTGLLSLQA